KARHSPEQIKYLEEYYHTDPKPDVHARSKISETIKLSPRAVQVWFQNRRAKSK
ncbi:homeobox, partial [Neoconidiobolus thromboides FSU 785]